MAAFKITILLIIQHKTPRGQIWVSGNFGSKTLETFNKLCHWTSLVLCVPGMWDYYYYFISSCFFKAGFKKPEICKILRHFNFRLGYLLLVLQ